MNERRWDYTETFIITCKLFHAIHEANVEFGNPNRAIMTIEDINSFQDLLKEHGFEIHKIKTNE